MEFNLTYVTPSETRDGGYWCTLYHGNPQRHIFSSSLYPTTQQAIAEAQTYAAEIGDAISLMMAETHSTTPQQARDEAETVMERIYDATLTAQNNVNDLDPNDPRYWQDVAEAANNVSIEAAQLRGIARHAAQKLEQNPNPGSAGA